MLRFGDFQDKCEILKCSLSLILGLNVQLDDVADKDDPSSEETKDEDKQTDVLSSDGKINYLQTFCSQRYIIAY